ncbi:major facilitator superfamily domain-containing protein [Schizophyllum amplum]|uniref:Major facilitator superfamily domain-containing protein n=1 Tax=Schizophyllum amplum TaxID=97359 RepID=A0A550CCC8_9AGAR|nr:major facilitator superfamily domain-containing protein [Auriculariopsis ampla]
MASNDIILEEIRQPEKSRSIHSATQSVADHARGQVYDSEARTPTAVSHAGSANSSATVIASTAFPEGGYGWTIVAVCSSIMFFSVGATYSWGVIQARLAADNLGPNSTLAFIGSISASWIALGAIVSGRLIRLIGSRNAGVLACFLLGLGQVLSGFSSRSVGGLFVTNGIVTGVGTCIGFMLCSTLPSQYFRTKRGTATGYIFAGAGAGGAVLSISINQLIARIGVPWTFRILGFSIWALPMPACLFLKDRMRMNTPAIEWNLFRDPKFVLLLIGSGIGTFPLFVPPFFIPLYAGSLGLSDTVGSLLLATFNLSSGLGRLGFGYLCDVLGPITSLTFALLLSALSLLAIWPVSNSLAPLVVFIILDGLGNGGFFSTVPSVVGHVYGPNRMTGVLGMVLSAWAAGYILGSPVAGWLLEMYGGSDAGISAYRPAMYYAGSLSLGAAGFVSGMRWLEAPRLLAFA